MAGLGAPVGSTVRGLSMLSMTPQRNQHLLYLVFQPSCACFREAVTIRIGPEKRWWHDPCVWRQVGSSSLSPAMLRMFCWLLCASTSLSVIPESALEQLSIIEEMSAALCTKVGLQYQSQNLWQVHGITPAVI